jgi:uncharacterized RDD family membrane protein YckC
MDNAEPPSRYPPADARRRLLGRAIDLGVAFAPLLLVPRGHHWAGVILSAALVLCSDSLFGPGRSLGKRLAGLRVVESRGAFSGRPATQRQSFLRNGFFLFGLVPACLGQALSLVLLAFACVCVVEAWVALMPLTRDLGQRRLGDLFAGTQVIDASIAAGAAGAVRISRLPVKPAAAAAPLASRAARQPRENKACA